MEIAKVTMTYVRLYALEYYSSGKHCFSNSKTGPNTN